MIIKVWNGTDFVENYAKTKAQLIYDKDNTETIFDSADKLKAKFLPNVVFDSLFYSDAVGSNSDLIDLTVQSELAAEYLKRSPKGLYYVATANIVIQGNPTTAQHANTKWYRTGLAVGDGTTSGTIAALEAGDWFILTEYSGSGTQADPIIANYAVVNNTYEIADSSVYGITKLSNRTTYASLSGNDVVTEGVLKTVINNASFATSGHIHGSITNDGKITTDTEKATGQKLVIVDGSNNVKRSNIALGASAKLWLANNGNWISPSYQDVGAAPTSHTHGPIENDGKITADTTKASGFKLVMTDSGGTIRRTNVALGSSTTSYLRNDGTWGTPPNDNTTYSAKTNGGLKLSGTAFEMNFPIAVQSSQPTFDASSVGAIWFDIS